MKKIHIDVQEKFIEFIDKLVKIGIYSSRAEAVRSALKDFITKESQFLSTFNSDIIKVNDLHKKYSEFTEEIKRELYPAYNHNRETLISTVK